MYYFDNAATSYPKPEKVYTTIIDIMKTKGANPGRGSHSMALEASRLIYNTRSKVADLFNIKDPLRVAFTQNATHSLNMAIKGYLDKGDHVITTSLEHNSVLRPLYSMEEDSGIELSIVEADTDGLISARDILSSVKENTRAVVITHASNLTGTILPIKEIGEGLKERGITLIVDASQSAGFLHIDVEELNIDILCFTGHKSLYGPQGSGGIYVREGIELTPIMEGGSGSHSKLKRQPGEMPDLLEYGTLNAPAIGALGSGIDFINEVGLDNIRRHEQELTTTFIEGIRSLPHIKIYGPLDRERTPVVTINIEGADPAEVSQLLDEEYGIATRPGMHCAPLAHRSIGTYESGAVRFSFGYFNTLEDIQYAVTALKEVVESL